MTQFQILYPHSENEWRPLTIGFRYAPHEGQQYLWSSYKEAEAARQCLLRQSPDAELRITLAGGNIGDLDWQTREKLRFADGAYQPTPWHDEPWYQARHEEHFCHISAAQPGKIAFTENAAKGRADRQLVMSPGRYLHRFFSEHLDNNAIEEWCARLSVLLQEHALKITQDADEIEEVYVGGPSSCMAHEASVFTSRCHPTRVYAGPDTALAYIGPRKDASARSVVWPARKIYTSIYGDVSRLRLLLENAGYTKGSLNGARIRRIEYGDSFVVPYIDEGDNLRDNGKYLVIGEGDISSDNTNGVADAPTCCDHCDRETDDRDTVHFADGSTEEWCYDCSGDHSTYCDYNNCRYSDDESFVTVYNNRGANTVLEEDAEDYGAVYLDDREEWWAKSCCRQCAATGIWFHAEDLTEYEGEWLSEDHLPEPFDDDDEALANAHILTWHQFQEEMAAIHAEVALWEAAGARAQAERLRRERAEAAQLRIDTLCQNIQPLADDAPPGPRGDPLAAIATTAPVPVHACAGA